MSSVPKKQVVLITGCSTGVGLALSVQLAKAGHKVYATMRDVAKATDLKAAADAAQVQVEVLPLDITDQKSVDECVAKIYSAEGKIDTLVNNAGVALFRPTETASMEEIQQCFDSNFFGAVRMAKAVLPRMRTDRSGRIVNISSVGGLIGQPLNDIYCAAKFAMDGWTESMAATLCDYNVHAVVVNPGGIQSAFVQNAYKVLAAGGGAKGEEYKETMGQFMKHRAEREARGQSNDPVDRVMQTSDEVAAVIKEAVEAEKPHFRYVTSEWAKAFVSHKIVDDEHGDKLIAKTRREILGVE